MRSKNIQPLCESVCNATELVPEVSIVIGLDAENHSKCETNRLNGLEECS